MDCIGIPTKNRPLCLKRCLDSFWRPDIRFIIVDDSDNQVDVEENQRVAAFYGAEYHGLETKKNFASKLNHPLIEYAIHPMVEVRTGGNRNYLQLITIGSRLLMIDDDVINRVAPAPGISNELVYSAKYDPTEFWFGIGNIKLEQIDILNLLDRMLDLTKTAALGVIGDSGMGASAYLFQLEGDSDRRFREAGRPLDHRVLRVVTNPTIHKGGLCMGLCLAMDNTGYLPPFLPEGRNQDGVFGQLLVSKGFLQGYLPWAIQHEPPVTRTRPMFHPIPRPADRIIEDIILNRLDGKFKDLVDNWESIRATRA